MTALYSTLILLAFCAIFDGKQITKPDSFVSTTAENNRYTCGGVSPLTRWSRTGRLDTIRMVIDTSQCEFTQTPLYFTSITGVAGHYLLVGVNAIYESTNTSFSINVRSMDGQTADTLMAWSAEYQWNLQWYGLL